MKTSISIRSNIYAGSNQSVEDTITIYGTEWCSWTTKQRQYFNKQGIKYTFVDCDEDKCPNFVNSFPTLDINGVVSSGYQEINASVLTQ